MEQTYAEERDPQTEGHEPEKGTACQGSCGYEAQACAGQSHDSDEERDACFSAREAEAA